MAKRISLDKYFTPVHNRQRMDGVVIRLAEFPDREALCRLYFEFHELHVRGVPDRLVSLGLAPGSYKDSDLYRSLERIIHDSDSAIFVAQATHDVIGFVEVYIRQDEPNPLRVCHRYGHLQSLMVLADFRRQGIGTRLVDAAEQWAKAKGAAEMRLDTWEFVDGPLRFYENAGYQTVRRMMARKL